MSDADTNMAILNIVKEGDPILRKTCRPVTEITPRIRQLAEDMEETLYEANGVGLAAPQVGILRRMVLVEVDDELYCLINPEIIESEGEQEDLEGCLSVPGMWAYIKRPQWVKVRAQDRNGDWFEAEGEGMTARCFCHEVAHLDGHLYTELADRLYTTEELEQLEREQEEQ